MIIIINKMKYYLTNNQCKQSVEIIKNVKYFCIICSYMYIIIDVIGLKGDRESERDR